MAAATILADRRANRRAAREHETTERLRRDEMRNAKFQHGFAAAARCAVRRHGSRGRR
jgi:hypothetical protein